MAGRPVVNASFALNYALGGLNVFGYHLCNVAVHIACALILFGIVRRTLHESRPHPLRRPGPRSGVCRRAALGAPSAEHRSGRLPHPADRVDDGAVLSPDALRLHPRGRGRSLEGMAGGGRCVVRPGHGMQGVDGHRAPDGRAVRPRVRVRLLPGAPPDGGLRSIWVWPAAWLVLAALLWSGPRVYSAGFATDVSPWTYLLNQTAMIVRYLWLSIWPRALVANYGWPRAADARRRAAAGRGGRRPCCCATIVGAAQAAAAGLPRRLVLRHAGADVEHRADCHRGGRRAADVPPAHPARRAGGRRWSPALGPGGTGEIERHHP